jgi:aminoglycoside phosphotransferase (APT) family kinase protein
VTDQRSGDDESAVEQGLARYLAEQRACPVSVTDLALASAGARRHNVLFTAHSRFGIEPMVATIMPTAELQQLPMTVEAETIRVAAGHGVPVPELIGSCDDPSWVGGPFFLTRRVEGRSVPRQVLRLVDQDPALGPRLARQCGDALARLHRITDDELPVGLPAPESGHSPARSALQRYRELVDELPRPSPAFELGLRWLADHEPPDSGAGLVHGDFRNGNLIVGPDGLRAVLDWEVCHLGAPMSDPGWMLVRMWRFGNDDRPVGGFAEVGPLREGYEAAGGRWDDAALRWWQVAGTLQWGLGLAQQARQFLDRTVPSIVMAASGRRVAEMEYDLLRLIE